MYIVGHCLLNIIMEVYMIMIRAIKILRNMCILLFVLK